MAIRIAAKNGSTITISPDRDISIVRQSWHVDRDKITIHADGADEEVEILFPGEGVGEEPVPAERSYSDREKVYPSKVTLDVPHEALAKYKLETEKMREPNAIIRAYQPSDTPRPAIEIPAGSVLHVELPNDLDLATAELWGWLNGTRISGHDENHLCLVCNKPGAEDFILSDGEHDYEFAIKVVSDEQKDQGTIIINSGDFQECMGSIAEIRKYLMHPHYSKETERLEALARLKEIEEALHYANGISDGE